MLEPGDPLGLLVVVGAHDVVDDPEDLAAHALPDFFDERAVPDFVEHLTAPLAGVAVNTFGQRGTRCPVHALTTAPERYK
ncbi:hypothetical protein GCM10027184_63910 [Saccharothrix stipae]